MVELNYGSTEMARAKWALLVMAGVLLVACTSEPDGASTSVPSTPASSTAASSSAGSSGPISGEPASSAPSSSSGSSIDRTTSASPSAMVPADDGVPKDLLPFYDQQLDWGDCIDYATTDGDRTIYDDDALSCAHLSVPLDYDKPAGTRITLGVMRSAATGTRRIGSMIMNPGGPGASGLSLLSYLQNQNIAWVPHTTFDLVSFDPRGVGSSRPLIHCRTDAEIDTDRAHPDRTRTAGEVAAARAQLKTDAQHCLTRTQPPAGVSSVEFLQHLGTREVVQDIDVLRSVLGDKKLTYLGFSYGTRLGEAYAEAYPERVRAMVLDGAVDPADSYPDFSVAQSVAGQQAFVDFAAFCAHYDDCPLAADGRRATEQFRAQVTKLNADPVVMLDGRALTGETLIDATYAALSFDESWQAFTTGLGDLFDRGAGDTVMAFADSNWNRDGSGKYSNFVDAYPVLICLDHPAMNAATQARLGRELAAENQFDGAYDPMIVVDTWCNDLGLAPTSKPHEPQLTGLPTTVIISTTHDPVTPYQDGVDLADDLHARLVTVEGTRHGSYLRGHACVDVLVNSYLLDLTLPKVGVRCT